LLGIILIFVVFVLLAAALHRWEHRGEWGYYPSGVLGVALVLLFVLLLIGRI
jgi:hypothetical protein